MTRMDNKTNNVISDDFQKVLLELLNNETNKSIFLSNLHHAYAQTDGTYAFPNSREGDMLKTAKREIEELLTINYYLKNKIKKIEYLTK